MELQGNTGAPSRIYVVNAISPNRKRTSRAVNTLNGAEVYDFLRIELAQWARKAGINDDIRKGRGFKIFLRDLYNKNLLSFIFTNEKPNGIESLSFSPKCHFSSSSILYRIIRSGKIS